ncbi:hypothetical protein ACH4NF_04375 [Streptomyces sp. NPDC017248]|uniref:hypothetical protein n=1 Tax=unclassified Streptomyces TaxID=2593676 RepID=UPI0037903864
MASARGIDCLEAHRGPAANTDLWSWLDYKPVMADMRRPGRNPRGGADLLLGARREPVAPRRLAAITDDVEAGTERCELGDASKLVDTALGNLLGSEQTITVAGGRAR